MKLLFKTEIKETGGKVAWLRSKGSRQTLNLTGIQRSIGMEGSLAWITWHLRSKT
jgi:hypothetical protein